MTQRAEAYRNNAEQCRRLAEHSRSPKHRDSWLKIAEQWLKMADDVDLPGRVACHPKQPLALPAGNSSARR